MRQKLISVAGSIFSEPMLRNLLFLCIITILIYPVYNLFFAYPSFTMFLVSNVEDDAVRTAKYLSLEIIPAQDITIEQQIDQKLVKKITAVKENFKLEKLKLFNATGTIVYSTDNTDIGTQNNHPYFFEIVAKGNTYSKMVRQGTPTLDGRVSFFDVVEVYVPIMDNNRLLGAFEIYYDITDKKKTLDLLVFSFSITLFAISVVLFIVAVVVMFKAGESASKRREAEEKLKKACRELDDRVRERTKELSKTNQDLMIEIAVRKKTELMLITARDQAEEANEAKSEFLANMSHELRTPMHGILGFAGFGLDKLQRGNQISQETLLEYFLEIQSCGNRLLALINDLLDLAKLESGKLKYIFEKMALSDLIKAIIKESAALVDEKQLKIAFNPIVVNDIAMMDSNRIMQVIRNLLSNAIKFSKSDGIITISIEDKENSLELSFSDKGMGIPDEELGVVFDKFIQSSRTKTGAGGTGLGLPISKQIISDHGGKIWAENNPEGGAVFRVVIPKRREANKKLGEILIEKKFITREVLQQTLDEQNLAE